MIDYRQLGFEVLQRSFEILKAPLSQPKMFWILTPLIASMLLMAFYFGRYKAESESWDAAFQNSFILMFASIDLLRYLHNAGVLFEFSVKNAVVAIVLFLGLFLAVLDFFHLLPENLAFGLSSGTTINVIIVFLVILVYSQIPIDGITGLAVLLLGLVAASILKLISALEVAPEEED